MTARVAIWWSENGNVAEGACLCDGRLQVERFNAVSPDDAVQQVLSAIKLARGFDVLVCPNHSNSRRVEDSQRMLAAAIALGAASLRGVETLECPLSWMLSFATHQARTRRVRSLGFLDLSPQNEVVVAINPRGPTYDFIDDDLSEQDWINASVLERTINRLSRHLNDPTATAVDDWLDISAAAGGIGTVAADRCGLKRLVIPAHAGGSASVGLLLSDIHVACSEPFEPESWLAVDGAAQMRVMYLRLMDQIASTANRLGYDIDDLTCKRCVRVVTQKEDSSISAEGFAPDELIQFYREYVEEVRADAAGAPTILKNEAIATGMIETSKPRLPIMAESSTIGGAGEPEQRVVIGPGKMLACLCEIDVPAGWRAEWESCGDVVMTRV